MALPTDELSTTSVTPGLGLLLTRMAATTDIDTAIRKVVDDYLRLKLAELQSSVAAFEGQWHMSFEEFAAACEQGTVGDRDAYSYSVEADYWEWEEAETLLAHYTALRGQWT